MGGGDITGLLGVLMLVGFMAWVFTAAVAGYQIFWVAFVREGTYLPAVFERTWWQWLSGGYRISVYLSLGLWCLCFDVGAESVLWEKGVVFFGVASGRSEGTMVGLTGRRNKARDAHETALRLIGVIGVANFILPSKCCLL